MAAMRSIDEALANLKSLLPDLEALYSDVHAHPELSMQETRTAGLAADRLRFQPAEETAQGAQAMIDDGLFERFPRPDVVLGQHVMVGTAGDIGGRAGTIKLNVRTYDAGVREDGRAHAETRA